MSKHVLHESQEYESWSAAEGLSKNTDAPKDYRFAARIAWAAYEGRQQSGPDELAWIRMWSSIPPDAKAQHVIFRAAMELNDSAERLDGDEAAAMRALSATLLVLSGVKREANTPSK